MASKPKSAESMQRSLAGYARNRNGEGGTVQFVLV